MEEAQLQDANLVWAQLQGAKLLGAELQGAILTAAQLQGADLEWAKLQGADLIEAQLQGADLRRASVRRGQFVVTNLSSADLRNINSVSEAPWDWIEADLIALLQGPPRAETLERVRSARFRATAIDRVISQNSISTPRRGRWHWLSGDIASLGKFGPDQESEYNKVLAPVLRDLACQDESSYAVARLLLRIYEIMPEI